MCSIGLLSRLKNVSVRVKRGFEANEWIAEYKRVQFKKAFDPNVKLVPFLCEIYQTRNSLLLNSINVYHFFSHSVVNDKPLKQGF